MDPAPRVALVVPCYKTKASILGVLNEVPSFVHVVYVVDDCCPENTGAFVSANCRDPRVRVLKTEHNSGVGGATMLGFFQAFSEGATLAVKADGDGQMRLEYLPDLLAPILSQRADFTKGNRFYDLRALTQMPLVRRLGNLGLSVLVKFVSGHWHVSDPTNGFIALHRSAFDRLSPHLIDRRFFFETSLLVHLNIIRATVLDIPIPARYGEEASNLSVLRCLLGFPRLLARHFTHRLLYRYLLLDINAASLFFVLGALSFSFGLCFGAYRWYLSWSSGLIQTPGTVAIALLTLIVGLQLLLQAILLDIVSPPQVPIQCLAGRREPGAASQPSGRGSQEKE
jgi:glycosyltransferase involved in cell wall biosynthesis